jgi:hypothetical protein
VSWAAVSVHRALWRDSHIRHYAQSLVEELFIAGDPDVEAARGLLDDVDDVAVEVESCRAELRGLYPDKLP